MLKVSVVIPVRNAADILPSCLDSILSLDYPKELTEIIIVDGMSTDASREVAYRYGVRIVENLKQNVVAARNIGFANAHGDIIAFTDADCLVAKDWLSNASKYFEDEKIAGVGGANLVPLDEKPFAKAVGLIFDYAYYFHAGAPTKIYKDVVESRFHGSNAIYRADVLRQVLPVDEQFYSGEDVIMDGAITKLGYTLLYVPDVKVEHYRRATPKKWWKQMFHYGEGKVLIHRNVEAINFLWMLLGISPVISLAILILIFWISPLIGLGALLAALLIYILSTVLFAYANSRSFKVAFSMPVVVGIFVLAWSSGFLREYFFPKVELV